MTGRWRGGRPEGDRSALARLVIVLLLAVLAATVLFSLASGASDASAWSVALDALSASGDTVLSARDRIIIHDIRLPRIVLGVLIGASLAVSGAVMQGLFRNPLADPGLIGVSAGSSLGAVAVIVLGATVLAPLTMLLGSFALPFAAFCGGLATTLVLYRISTRQRADLRRHDAARRHRAGGHGHGFYRASDLHGRRPAIARPYLLVARIAGRRDLAEDRRGGADHAAARWRQRLSWRAASTRWPSARRRQAISAFRCSG